MLYNRFRMAESMADEASIAEPNPLRHATLPVALSVAAIVAAAWYVTWSTSDWTMAVLGTPFSSPAGARLVLFFALMTVMMVAMMLPSALPMVLTYAGLTRLEAGRPTKPTDLVGTALFASTYFLVWGGFGVAALLSLVALGFMGPMMDVTLLVPAGVLVAAGLYQVTRTKEVCLSHCQSPMGFVIGHWRAGRMGALRMGLRHSTYCVGCCWLFMLVLFVAGAMSLIWMGAISVVIFVEKLGPATSILRRAIGAVLVVLGTVVGAGALGVL